MSRRSRARCALDALVIAGVALASLLAVARLAQACSAAAPEPTGTETHFPLMYGDRPTVAQLSSGYGQSWGQLPARLPGR